MFSGRSQQHKACSSKRKQKREMSLTHDSQAWPPQSFGEKVRQSNDREPGARTRVLLYVPGLEAGGTECKVERLACALDQTRFEPIVAWSHWWGAVGVRLQAAGVPVYHLPLNSP